MSKRNDGGAAFPHPLHYNEVGTIGLSMRDYLAAHAPECPTSWPTTTEQSPLGRLAQWRYAYADAMLAERQK